MFEVSVVVEPVSGNGYRASCAEPLPATAEGASREEAVDRLRHALEARLKGGAEVVRVRVGERSTPVWPDDDVTRAWLAGIADTRSAADARPDPWDGSS